MYPYWSFDKPIQRSKGVHHETISGKVLVGVSAARHFRCPLWRPGLCDAGDNACNPGDRLGAYAFADGIFSLWSAASGSAHGDDRWLVGLQGVIGLAAGIITLIMPGATAIGLLIAIAAWSLVVGVLQIAAAIKLRKEIEGEFWLGLSGLLSVLFGLFIIARPGEGALAVIWVIGGYALVFGIFLVAFAFRIKGRGQTA